ncbi:MAG: penicillin-binding transpeptidase domain-containing protein [Terracidiphilus sp.]|jgi:membrane carboxypeptidase/penicillin-binding protein
MKLSRVVALGLAPVLVLAGSGMGAAALDAPHTLHHAKRTEPHLAEPHRAGSHHAAAHAARSAKTHTASTHASTTHSATTHAAPKAAPAHHQVYPAAKGKARTGSRRVTLTSRRHRYHERFTASSYAQGDILSSDVTAGEDPVVRQAAIDALGDMNGTAVVIDPSNGRILAMVNQKLALSPGAEPCSTIKLTVALAALSEGLVTSDTPVQLPGFHMDMTDALAKSNNLYFEELGRELGFERVRRYANQFGLGELAGYQIEGEHLGVYPDKELPAAEGGVGRMCSFGKGVSLTPLQLGAFVAAIANGGTLYYLQHPNTAEEAAKLEPRVKRTLNIARYVPDLQDGMAAAVEYGTARKLRANFQQLPVFGKTGTCSEKGTRFGWFSSWSDSPQRRLVTVFFLEGGRPTFGPRAAEMTGEFYQNLWDHNWFAAKGQQDSASVGPASSQRAQP